MDKLKSIANILPEGLSEETVESIFELVDSTINEQVAEQIGLLEAKVNSYLRTKVEQLKEQALAELSEENEVFKNARLFESVRTLMSLELNNEDEENALSEMTNQAGELQEESDVLAEQVNTLVLENEKLNSTVKVLSSQVELSEQTSLGLKEDKAQLLEEVENLEAVKDEAFNSSEKAVVISRADNEINEEKTYNGNAFLTPEVMKFMPQSN